MEILEFIIKIIHIMLFPFTIMAYIFLQNPIAALIAGLIFGTIFIKYKKPIILITALLWLIYAADEYAMKLNLFCGGNECNIRIDLVFFYPALLFLSIMSIIQIIKCIKDK